MGRYLNRYGTLCYSMSYTRLGTNFSNCVFSVEEKYFRRVEVFVRTEEVVMAVVRSFRIVQQLTALSGLLDNSLKHQFEIKNLGRFELVEASNLGEKCVLLPTGETEAFVASIVTEGFEHN